MSIREELNSTDIEHRTQFADYSTHHSASDWHREHLERLHAFWVSVNRDHYADACVPPHILLAEPKTPRALGDHANVSGWGSRNQIRIRPTLIDGQHKILKPGDEYAEGRMRYVEDVLLHESVHQYCDEVLHSSENSYKGHGPVFAGECTRIGAALGLPPVRPAKARGKNKDMPSCAFWPHNVRPADYYLGALADPEPKPEPDLDDDEETLTFPCPLDADQAVPVLAAHFDKPSLKWIAKDLVDGKVSSEPHEVAAWLQRQFSSEELANIWEGIMISGVASRAPKPKQQKKRGRKPKAKATVSPNGDTAAQPKRRGRPPKQRTADEVRA